METRGLFVFVDSEKIPAFAGMTAKKEMSLRAKRGNPVNKVSVQMHRPFFITGSPRSLMFPRDDNTLELRHPGESRDLFALVVPDGIPRFRGMTKKKRYDDERKRYDDKKTVAKLQPFLLTLPTNH